MRGAWFLLAATLSVAAFTGADEPARKYRVVAPKTDGVIATGINGKGDVIGFEWVEEKERPGVVEQKPFVAKGAAITYLPLLEGYTATFPAAISDDGAIVGRSSKPAPPDKRIPLRNQAFIWDARSGMRGLGVLKGEWASFATGISRDGRRVSGFSVGENVSRACVWDRDGEDWKISALPHETKLGSNHVAISGNGLFVAAVDKDCPCLWTRAKDGAWSSERIGPASSLVPRSVNDSGTVAGVQFASDGATHAVIWTRKGGVQALAEPKGYERSEAFAVNNEGAVVGMIDGPRGSKVGPNGFVYENGRSRILEGGPNFAYATAVNDDGQVAGVMEKPEDDDHPEPKKPGE